MTNPTKHTKTFRTLLDNTGLHLLYLYLGKRINEQMVTAHVVKPEEKHFIHVHQRDF